MEQRVQDSLQKIDDKASEIQRDLEKNIIRKIQAASLRNGAKCCDNLTASAEEVHACVQRTQQPVAQVQSVIKKELDDFQQRLQRCLMTCQDRAKDAMTANSTLNGVDRKSVEGKFADCMCICADEHFNLLPLVRQRLVDDLSRISEQ